MNEVTRVERTQQEMVRVLGNSLYPGAKSESIELVLSWCRVNGLDPMLRPVHIVPTRVKNERGQWEWRDTLMPGIATYRILAARSGEYAGKSEPEFGPDVIEEFDGVKVTYPRWCKITVQRMVGGTARSFTAVEHWLENYREAGNETSAPNRMWKKRAYGQLAKCAEAQALRMAFPEFSGGAVTAEEMEGSNEASFTGPTIEHTEPKPAPVRDAGAATTASPRKKQTVAEWLEALKIALHDATSAEEVDTILCAEGTQRARESFRNGAKEQLEAMIAEALTKWFPKPPDEDEPPAEEDLPDLAEIALP